MKVIVKNTNGVCRLFWSLKGQTLLEIIMGVMIIAILASLAVPTYLSGRRIVEKVQCNINQKYMMDAISLYYDDKPFVSPEDGFGDGEVFIDLDGKVVGNIDRDLSRLIDDQRIFDCPSDGLKRDGADSNSDYVTDGNTIACLTDNITSLKTDGNSFLHDYASDTSWKHNSSPAPIEPPAPLTSLGPDFEEITGSMILLVQNFYDENGRYPRSWGDYVYTDIGLDPDEWEKAYDGIIYSPGGNRIKITPEDGYTFYVNGIGGDEKVLKSSYNWSLWYSVEYGKWYYHSIEDDNEIDITTLRVEK